MELETGSDASNSTDVPVTVRRAPESSRRALVRCAARGTGLGEAADVVAVASGPLLPVPDESRLHEARQKALQPRLLHGWVPCDDAWLSPAHKPRRHRRSIVGTEWQKTHNGVPVGRRCALPLCQWRRGESNPGPKLDLPQALRAYPTD